MCKGLKFWDQITTKFKASYDGNNNWKILNSLSFNSCKCESQTNASQCLPFNDQTTKDSDQRNISFPDLKKKE